MKIWIGKTLILIGIGHSIVGFLLYHNILAELMREMLFNTVCRQPEREAAFWFLFGGIAAMILGGLINWIEQKWNNKDNLG